MSAIPGSMRLNIRDEFRIPVLDISSPSDGLAREMVDVAEKYGFIFIRNRSAAASTAQIDGAFTLVCLILPANDKAQKEQTHARGSVSTIL